MAKRHKRAAESHLVILMLHIIKWHIQPEARSYSRAQSIENARREIQDIQTDHPALTDETLHTHWQTCFQKALKRARKETKRPAAASPPLTWQQVFEHDFSLEN